MSHRVETPFESIENAQEYLKLLLETLEEAKRDIIDQVTIATDQMSHRRVQALRMVQFKLEKLQQHLTVSSRSLMICVLFDACFLRKDALRMSQAQRSHLNQLS